jgi:Vitamin K-dependent gamma-carboxylase
MSRNQIVARLFVEVNKPVIIAPLVIFRMAFGAMLVYSTLRFMYFGWIEEHYVEPLFHFKYFGFEWVEPISLLGLYLVHFLIIIASLGVIFAHGISYRLAAVVLFLSFTYAELIDLTYYLNHYYFVSCICLLLCILPTPNSSVFARGNTTPNWTILIFKLQLSIVYIYAGLAKINEDWLLSALPLKIWLPIHESIPFIGEIFTWELTPYLFSWFGMIYDCTIIFFLFWKKTRLFAYFTVVVFHTLTALLFPIGVFPWVMIGSTLIFFHYGNSPSLALSFSKNWTDSNKNFMLTFSFLALFFIFQLLFPWRYLLYEGNLFWTEEGYRFSWRVMLAEKAGTAFFYVKDSKTREEKLITNSDFLNVYQEKQMSTQPDMILQFAHFLGKEYEKRGFYQPQVRAEVYVSLNGRPSKLLINPKADLMKEKDTFLPKKWILKF